MHDQSEPETAEIAKWPFFLGDILLLSTACFIHFQMPMGLWQIAFIVLCVAGGATLGILPFLLEYRLALKLTEARALTGVVDQIRNLEAVAGQIGDATGRWQNVQDAAHKTAGAAKEIAERMAAEMQSFSQFMQRVNDTEKANLRLEVEKLRRAENEWLQVLVRVLDHVYALHIGAQRSGQPNLIQQLGNFQSACRDAARRVGLTPFAPNPSDPFDVQRHQRLDGDDPPPPGAAVAETVATGYTFQGQLLRPALVRLDNHQPTTPADGAETGSEAAANDSQNQLPLDAPPGPA